MDSCFELICPNLNKLMQCAELRVKCSCLEEYLIERDLKFSMSKLERMLDFIAIIEKHPKISAFINADKAGSVPTAITLFANCFSFLTAFATSMLFPYLDSSIYVASFVSYFLGVSSIAFAFCMEVFDAKHAIHMALINNVFQ